MSTPLNDSEREDERPLVRFSGAWGPREKERLRAVLEHVEDNLSPLAQLTMNGPWEARCFDDGAHYGLHRKGGPLIVGHSLQEILDRLPGSEDEQTRGG